MQSFIPASPLWSPLLLLVAVTLVTTLNSIDRGKSAQLGLSWLPAGFVAYLLAQYFQERVALKLLFRAMTVLILGLSLALLGIAWQQPTVHPSVWIRAFDSPLLLVPNDTTLFAVLAPFSWVLVWRPACRSERLLALVSLLLGMVTMVVYQNGVGLCTLLLALVGMMFVFHRRVALVLAVTLLLLGLASDAWLGWPLLGKFVRFAQTLDARLPLWLAAWSIFLDYPLLGSGPHTFGLLYQDYLQQWALPAWLASDPRYTPWAHNLYLETLAEQGALGAAVLCWLVYRSLQSNWRALLRSDPGNRVYTVALLAAFSCFWFAACLELTFKRLWVLLGLAVLVGISVAIIFLTEGKK